MTLKPVTTLDPIAEQIWKQKYRFVLPDGTPQDHTIEASWQRVAQAVAAAEKPEEREKWAQEFYDILKGFTFLPAGRILAGAGTQRQVTLFNCFVMGTIADSLSGIFDALKEASLTMQQGGGIGEDFSTLRPKGALVHGVGADASGPLSFMDVWDSMCRTIMSAGARRGAMMGMLRCDHPDIEAFIAAKQDKTRLRNFNLSVLITDRFMAAVEKDEPWELTFDGQVYKTLSARALWDQIMQATYAYAEPGVVFIDRINQLNALNYCEAIAATNPCGEQPLPPYGACLLGSLNLTQFIKQPFSKTSTIDLNALANITKTAVRFLDNVVDVSNYPLQAQREEAFAKRRIGLGITGLANALSMVGLTYGTAEAAETAGRWMAHIKQAAYEASSALAQEKGSFPLFKAEAYLNTPHGQALAPELRQAISRHGLRHGLLTSIAPTGTISLFAGNVSSGIEPPFSLRYERKVLATDGGSSKHEVMDYAAKLWQQLHGLETPWPEQLVTAQTLSPQAHLTMMAALQPHVDSAISKTINVPEAYDFDSFRDIYREAYHSGLKGCTTFRPNEVTGSVLSLSGTEDNRPSPISPRDRALPGFTYKLKWPESDHAIYVTLNDRFDEAGMRRPFEIFINSKNMDHYAWTVALTRMISAVFRRGGDVSFVVEELKAVFDPRGGQWLEGHYVPSLLAAIGGIIEEHMLAIGFIKQPLTLMSKQPVCPNCGEGQLLHQEGCITCPSCGFSKCS